MQNRALDLLGDALWPTVSPDTNAVMAGDIYAKKHWT